LNVTIRSLLLASLASGAMTAAAHAQEADSSDDITVVGQANRGAATTATRVPLEALETPFTISVLPGRIIEESGARTLSDALRYSGTVGGTDNFGNAGEFFTSRGFQLAAGSNYFRDGLRYRKYGQVPIYDMERIEILRGPASVIYGALEPGGVINFVSRNAPREFGATARLRYGSYDYVQGMAEVGGPITKGVRARVQGFYEDSDSFRDRVGNTSKGVNGAVEIDLGPNTLLSGRASWFKDHRTGDRGIVLAYKPDGEFGTAAARYGFADVPRSRFLGEPFANNNFRDINASVSLRHDLNSDWQLRGDLIRSDQKEDRIYIWATNTALIVPASGTMARTLGTWAARLKGTLGRAEVAGKLTLGPTVHKLLFGAEYEHFNNDRTQTTRDYNAINIYAPTNLDTLPTLTSAVSTSPYGSLFKSRGAYVQDVIEIGSHFVALGGVRYSKVTDDNKLNNTRRQTASGTTPQVGLVWRPTRFISPYVSFTRSFIPQSGTDYLGNSFAPQKAKQIEGGVKFDWRAMNTVATVAIFKLDRENLTVTDPDHPLFSRLSGLQRSKGLELSIDSAPAEGLRVTLNYNYLASAKFIIDNLYVGNTIPNAAKHALGGFVSYDLRGPLAGLSVNGGATYVSKRYGIATNAFYLPSYTLFDAGARYRLTKNIDLSVNVRNIFDKTYYTGAINSTTIGVGTPRTFLIGAGVRI
jgi:iron complex outermembrane receptor protein